MDVNTGVVHKFSSSSGWRGSLESGRKPWNKTAQESTACICELQGGLKFTRPPLAPSYYSKTQHHPSSFHRTVLRCALCARSCVTLAVTGCNTRDAAHVRPSSGLAIRARRHHRRRRSSATRQSYEMSPTYRTIPRHIPVQISRSMATISHLSMTHEWVEPPML